MTKTVRIEFTFYAADWAEANYFLSEDSIRHILKKGGQRQLEETVLAKKRLRKINSTPTHKDPFQ